MNTYPKIISSRHCIARRPVRCAFTSISTRHPSRHGYATAAKAPSKPAPKPEDREPPTFTARHLTELKQRIGKCVTHGLTEPQTEFAGMVLQEIAKDWRELTAGSEGFLTAKARTGLYRREVVWGEMDLMNSLLESILAKLRTLVNVNNLNQGHVNNVMYNRYAESARTNWAHNYGNYIDPAHKKEWNELCTARGIGMILKSITTDFKFPMTWPDHITVYHKLRKMPAPHDDSFQFDVIMLSERHQRPAARCVEDIVIYDYTKGRRTQFQPFLYEAFRDVWRLQEEGKAQVEKKLQRLLFEVLSLETTSWNKSNPIENLFGGSSAQSAN